MRLSLTLFKANFKVKVSFFFYLSTATQDYHSSQIDTKFGFWHGYNSMTLLNTNTSKADDSKRYLALSI
jgi:hypothetical protein